MVRVVVRVRDGVRVRCLEGAVQVDDEGVRDAGQDAPLELRLLHHLGVGAAARAAVLADGLHRKAVARVRTRHLEHALGLGLGLG